MSTHLDNPDSAGQTPSSDTSLTGDAPVLSRRALNQDLHQRGAVESPIQSIGVAGEGAEKIARNIARANTYAPTKGREFAAAAYARGAEGEVLVAEALKWLPGDQYIVLHDQPWPGRPKANIDHIVIGPNGIFVVDAKNWSGNLSATQDGLFQNGKDRTNTLVDIATQAGALTKLLREIPALRNFFFAVHPVLAFISEQTPVGQFLGVNIVKAQDLAPFIGAQQPVMQPTDAQALAPLLEQALIADRKQAVTAHAQNRSAYVARQRKREAAANAENTRPKGRSNNNSSPLSARQARKKAKTRSNLIKLLLIAALLAVIYLKPELFSEAVTWFTTWVTGVVTDTAIPGGT